MNCTKAHNMQNAITFLKYLRKYQHPLSLSLSLSLSVFSQLRSQKFARVGQPYQTRLLAAIKQPTPHLRNIRQPCTPPSLCRPLEKQKAGDQSWTNSVESESRRFEARRRPPSVKVASPPAGFSIKRTIKITRRARAACCEHGARAASPRAPGREV